MAGFSFVLLCSLSGRHVFTADERFQILKPVEDHEQSLRPTLHQPNLTEWILQIQFVQQRDGGFYICQVFLAFLFFSSSSSSLALQRGDCYLQLNPKAFPPLHCIAVCPFFSLFLKFLCSFGQTIVSIPYTHIYIRSICFSYFRASV